MKGLKMTMTIDPVCGMRVDSANAAAQTDYNGRAVFFCSEECQRIFETNPSQYIQRSDETTCAECGGVISQEDLVCPHCGISLAAG
jgi:YHS domain-containing protein